MKSIKQKHSNQNNKKSYSINSQNNQNNNKIIKGHPHKLSIQDIQQNKTIVTTKEQTYSTFQQHCDFHENRIQFNGPFKFKNNNQFNPNVKTHRSRKSCLQKIQDCPISPFSSPERKSLTPRIKRTNNNQSGNGNYDLQLPFNLKPLDCKKINKIQKKVDKKSKKPLSPKKKKKKSFKEDQTRRAFHNEFIKRMEDRPITQLPQEQFQATSKKPFRNKIKQLKKSKVGKIKDLFDKIVVKNQAQFPTLQIQQIRAISVVSLLQSLWRQSQVQRKINFYRKPSPSTTSSNRFFENTFSFHENVSKDLLSNKKNLLRQKSISFDQKEQINIETPIKNNQIQHQQQQGRLSTEKLIIKNMKVLESISPRIDKLQEQYDWKSPPRNKLKIEKPSPINLRQLQLSDELSQISNSKQFNLRNFVECYRQMSLSKRKKKINVFNLPQSLSEKCLFDKFYRKVFHKHSQKITFLKSNYEKKKEKQTISNIIQKNNIKNQILCSSPTSENKSPYNQLQILYTEAHDQQLSTPKKPNALITKVFENNESSQEKSESSLKKKIFKHQYGNLDDNQDIQIQKIKQISDGRIIKIGDQFKKQLDSNKDINPDDQMRQQFERVLQIQKDQKYQQNEKQYQKSKQQLSKQKQKIYIKPQQTIKQSLKNLKMVSQFIVQILIDEFVKESNPNVNKKRKQQKQIKKARLPGLSLTQNSINEYLSDVIEFIKQKQIKNVSKSMSKVNAFTILKLYRSDFLEDLFEQRQDYQLQDEDNDWSIIPKNLFFQHQAIFQEKKLVISEQNEKYTNFILGLSKITNKCLMDCFVQFLQKFRTDNIQYPWDMKNKINGNVNIKLNRVCSMRKSIKLQQLQQYQQQNQIKYKNIKKVQSFETQIQKILQQTMQCAKNTTLRQCFKKLGRLHKKNEQVQQQKLLLNLNQQYKCQGRQWLCIDQMFQTRLQISDEIMRLLIDQISQQLILLQDNKQNFTIRQ